MQISSPLSRTRLSRRHTVSQRSSLSNYFPKGTQYFYGYPAGDDSGFLNKVAPATEELVAARSLSCAGPWVSVVTFSSTGAPQVNYELISALDIPQVDPSLQILLPKSIDVNVRGKARNKAIMAALEKNITVGSLVMAQPFTDPAVENLYQINPKLTVWLNDKANMTKFVQSSLMPRRLCSYECGSDFAADRGILSKQELLPIVVKVSSSSSGDGVYICYTLDDVKKAQAEIKLFEGAVFVEKFVKPVKNYAVHFGIPFDQSKVIDIIGFNEQITSANGAFLGGIVAGGKFPAALKVVTKALKNDILPFVRHMGWYGIGGVDVIVDDQNKAYLIDFNFRMTGMSAYHFLTANGKVTRPMFSFGASFEGTREQFERIIMPFASKYSRDKFVQIVALSRHAKRWDFNGALMYKDDKDLSQKIQTLLRLGIDCPVFKLIIDKQP